MTTANPHRIGRQLLELELATAGRAAQLQQEAALTLRRGAPAIEQLFDRLVGSDEILRLERLEIDLGELRGADWGEQLVARLLDQLRGSLAGRSGRAAAGPRPAAARRSAPADAQFEQFLFFLARGRLPWWGRRPARPWHEVPPEPRDPAGWRSLGELLRRDWRARERLVLSAGDPFLDALVAELAGLEEAARALHALAPAAAVAGRRSRWRRQFWLETLAHAVGAEAAAAKGAELVQRLLVRPDPMPTATRGTPGMAPEPRGDAAAAPEPLLPEPWHGWLQQVRQQGRAAAAAAVGDPAGAAPPAALPPARDQQLAVRGVGPAAAEPQPAAPASPRPGGKDRPDGEDRAAAAAEAAAAPAAPPAATPSPAPVARPFAPSPAPGAAAGAEGAIYAGGAGAVILHPFLEEFFATRGLLIERRFRDPAARARAVHLLAHLTFGAADLPEYELLLAKLLCALPWEEPLAPAELDEDDRAACDELLAAVLKHWTALKSASSRWLREQFFLRDGKLESVDGGWKLTVERRAQDVLLTRLPWGIGMIRLPWMSELLYVSWAE